MAKNLITDLPVFLTPDDITTAPDDFGYGRGTAVTWSTGEWVGSGNPAPLYRGLRFRYHLAGEPVMGREHLAGTTDVHEPDAQAVLAQAVRTLIAYDGSRHLLRLKQQIEELGDPEDLLSKSEERRLQFRTQLQTGIASPAVQERAAQVEARRAQINDLRTRYNVVFWRLLAHLYRHGMVAKDMAQWLGEAPVQKVERYISSVTTLGAASILGVERKTWSGYVARRQAPPADDHIGSEPVWHLDTILTHQDTRPGRPGRPRTQS